jgi:ATP-dependent exoDNAse (exonuclease V) beta subunit
MTIHQAKGLEFDVVIVPGMARKPRGDDKTLVALQEFHNEDGEDSSLLAPLPARIKPEASLYEYLRAVESERSAFEQQRLLYVACTRARHQLHLLGKYSNSKSKGVYAPYGSLMELLFPAFEDVIDLEADAPRDSDSSDDSEDTFAEPQAYPLLQLQGAPLLPLAENPEQAEEICVLPELPTRKSVALGGAVHDWLELIHDNWEQGWGADWFEQNSAALESSLRRAGFSAAEAAEQLPSLKHMLIQCISTEPGRVVISPEGKQQSWTELPLLRREGNRISKHIIDRLYQDENSELVIVDYKTGTESQEAREHWASQLQRYKDLLQSLDSVSVSSTAIFQVSDNQLIDLSRETEESI